MTAPSAAVTAAEIPWSARQAAAIAVLIELCRLGTAKGLPTLQWEINYRGNIRASFIDVSAVRPGAQGGGVQAARAWGRLLKMHPVREVRAKEINYRGSTTRGGVLIEFSATVLT